MDDQKSLTLKALDLATLEKLLFYLKQNAHQIFIRVQIDGLWQAASLAELTDELWAEQVAQFIWQGMLPDSTFPESEEQPPTSD
jgi:hypothetical protein